MIARSTFRNYGYWTYWPKYLHYQLFYLHVHVLNSPLLVLNRIGKFRLTIVQDRIWWAWMNRSSTFSFYCLSLRNNKMQLFVWVYFCAWYPVDLALTEFFGRFHYLQKSTALPISRLLNCILLPILMQCMHFTSVRFIWNKKLCSLLAHEIALKLGSFTKRIRELLNKHSIR